MMAVQLAVENFLLATDNYYYYNYNYSYYYYYNYNYSYNYYYNYNYNYRYNYYNKHIPLETDNVLRNHVLLKIENGIYTVYTHVLLQLLAMTSHIFCLHPVVTLVIVVLYKVRAYDFCLSFCTIVLFSSRYISLYVFIQTNILSISQCFVKTTKK